MSVQLFYADYQGLFYERPSTALGIFELALDDAWLGIIADVPNYADFHACHCVGRPSNKCNRTVYRSLSGVGVPGKERVTLNVELGGALISIEHECQFRQELHWFAIKEVRSKSPLHYSRTHDAN